MNTVKSEMINEIIINKSRFITVLTNINDINEVQNKISQYKKIYKNATHYCTAYIINNHEKCDDDGEPSGTAGLPMLNVLKNNNLTNVLCIVIRYFGGVKLGAGGLVRAYSKSVTEAISKAEIATLVNGYFMEIEFSYNNIKEIDYLLKNLTIAKTFQTNITYIFKIPESDYLKIESSLKKLSKILKKESILITV